MALHRIFTSWRNVLTRHWLPDPVPWTRAPRPQARPLCVLQSTSGYHGGQSAAAGQRLITVCVNAETKSENLLPLPTLLF